jgi:hypothetical protein
MLLVRYRLCFSYGSAHDARVQKRRRALNAARRTNGTGGRRYRAFPLVYLITVTLSSVTPVERKPSLTGSSRA